MANKYLLADLLLFESGEGNKATSPSCATENKSIDASNSSMEMPIATHHMRGDANENSLPMAIKCLFANILFFVAREANEATSPSFEAENVGIDASSALLVVLIAT